ncbi:DNA-methyltransferase [Thomasclavelia cocleata]|uniref:DNA-methyltransferase n=1 Tax=Thomasclavelia cocleata TaxID=69824 RepID=UPI0024326ACF|nr:site-specific DNA-methyltransferase [Thomasclavelia cocleata]
MYNIKKGDCLELMKEIPNGSIDMILCDLPYGSTAASWDVIIPFELLWEQYKRITKRGAHIVLFSTQPFTTKLINSNIENYKYNWYWKKNNATGGQFAKTQPMRCIEDICVFRYDLTKSDSGRFVKCREYLQSEKNKCGRTLKELQELLKSSMTSHYFTNGRQFSLPTREEYQKLQKTGYFSKPYNELLEMFNIEMMAENKESNLFIYNPQGLIELKKEKKHKDNNSELYRGIKSSGKYQKYTNYPKHLLQFENELNKTVRYHPTQKPVAILQYLIKTYTDEGHTVLDNCMGSGSTGVACLNVNRNFIGFELEDKYFNIAKKKNNYSK